MIRTALIGTMLTSIVACDASGLLCSREIELVSGSALSTHIKPYTEIVFKKGLQGTISSGSVIQSSVRTSALLINEGSSDLFVESVKLSYGKSESAETGTTGVPILELNTCGDHPVRSCIQLSTDGSKITRVPVGGALDLRFRSSTDSLPTGTQYSQTLTIKYNDESDGSLANETVNIPIILAERRLNCVTGSGHGYREVSN